MAKVVGPRVGWRSYTNERGSEPVTRVAPGSTAVLTNALVVFVQGSGQAKTTGTPH